jgi:hypothetical protein
VSAVGYLVIAGVLTVGGSVVLWLLTRRPTTLTSGIDEFHREMNALDPRQASAADRRRHS